MHFYISNEPGDMTKVRLAAGDTVTLHMTREDLQSLHMTAGNYLEMTKTLAGE